VGLVGFSLSSFFYHLYDFVKQASHKLFGLIDYRCAMLMCNVYYRFTLAIDLLSTCMTISKEHIKLYKHIAPCDYIRSHKLAYCTIHTKIIYNMVMDLKMQIIIMRNCIIFYCQVWSSSFKKHQCIMCPLWWKIFVTPTTSDCPHWKLAEHALKII